MEKIKPIAMELLLMCVLLLALLFITLLHFLPILKTFKNKGLPPGKTGWPVIGETLEFLSSSQKGVSEEFIHRRMAKYSADVFKTSLIGDHVAVLCGAAGTKVLFSNTNKLVKRWVPKPIKKIILTPELNATIDRSLKPALLAYIKADGLRSFVGVMDAMAQRHLESHWHQQVITVYPSVNQYVFALGCRLFLSIEDPEVMEKLFPLMVTLASGIPSAPINLPRTRLYRTLKAKNALLLECQQIVNKQRLMESSSLDGIKKNLLSYLLQEYEDDNEVAHGIIGMLFSGYGPVSSVLGMIFKVLADYPDTYRHVYQENMEVVAKKKLGEALSLEDIKKLKYAWNVAREVMRLYSPATILTREAMTDFTYAGHHIPKGYKLLTSISAIHKDPKYFPEPEKFDPSRFDGNGPLPYTFIPFGGGPNVCPGMSYSQLMIQVFMYNAVKKFKWKTLIPDEKIIGVPHMKPAQGLPVLLHPHTQ